MQASAGHGLCRSARALGALVVALGVGGADVFAADAAFKASPEAAELSAAAKTQSPEEIYQRLLPLESRYAGDVDYDYFLGTAALDSGHASAAVFALQRAVATAPSYSGARLELARAYYAIGDNESARREFQTLQKEQPPPRVAAMIDEYLDAIDRRSGAYRTRYNAMLEASAGYDSNANGATGQDSFMGFELNDRSRARSSAYYGLTAAGQVSSPFAPRWRLLGEGAAQQRNYPRASFVDTTLAHLGGGLEWARDRLSLTGLFSGTYAALQGRRNNTNVAFDFNAAYAFSEAWQAALGGRAAALRFADALSAENVDSFLGSVALTRNWSGKHRVQIVTALTGGHERAKEAGSPFGRNLIGGRASAFVAPSPTLVVSGSVAVLHSAYQGLFPFFDLELNGGQTAGLSRRDNQYSARAALDWKDLPWRRWAIGTQVTYIDNRSSISLFSYHRVDVSVMLRREFR